MIYLATQSTAVHTATIWLSNSAIITLNGVIWVAVTAYKAMEFAIFAVATVIEVINILYVMYTANVVIASANTVALAIAIWIEQAAADAAAAATWLWNVALQAVNVHIWLSIAAVSIAKALYIAWAAEVAAVVFVCEVLYAVIQILKYNCVSITISIKAVTVAFWLVDTAIAAVSLTTAFFNGLMSFSTVRIWLWNAAIVVWKAIVSAAVFVSGLWTASTVSWTFWATAAKVITWLLALAIGGVKISTLLATAATWLWNAALTVMNLQVIIPLLVSLALLSLVIGGISTIFAVLGSAVWAVYAAAGAVFGVLGMAHNVAGPISVIGDLFGEWWMILKAIWQVLTVDMDLAWKMMAAGFELMIEQIKVLWPPLWTFISGGFQAIAELAGVAFEVEFNRAFKRSQMLAAEQAGLANDGMRERHKNEMQYLDLKMGKALKYAQARMTDLMGAFDYKETDAIREKRKAMEEVGAEIDKALAEDEKRKREAKAQVAALTGKDKDQAMKNGQEIGDAMDKGIAHEIKNLDAVLKGSAESLKRILAYREDLGINFEDKKAEKPKGAVAPLVAAAGALKMFEPARHMEKGNDQARQKEMANIEEAARVAKQARALEIADIQEKAKIAKQGREEELKIIKEGRLVEMDIIAKRAEAAKQQRLLEMEDIADRAKRLQEWRKNNEWQPVPGGPKDILQPPIPARNEREELMIALLKDIADTNKKMAKKGGLEIEDADL